MLVFRLTDENIRRERGKAMVPLIEPLDSIERDKQQVSLATLEWMIRFESYKAHLCRAPRDASKTSDQDFSKMIDETVSSADAILVDSLLQKKRMALVVCKRCKSDDIIKDEKQTKSADEGMTGFYLCNACGFSWRQEG